MSAASTGPARGHLRPVPDRLVVLTFDDGCRSHATFVAPLLKRLGFGATFFITEGLGFLTDKGRYMTWDQVRELHEAGFEIGNHTRGHRNVKFLSKQEFRASLEHIERCCDRSGIPRPVTFCYPGYVGSARAVAVLRECGYLFARRGAFPEFRYNPDGGRGPAYDPTKDHPLLIPTTGAAGPQWHLDDLTWAVEQARDGKIAVLTFHGVPDQDHPWVHTDPQTFAGYMEHLHDQRCTVIAARDLVQYVDPTGARAILPGLSEADESEPI